VVSRKCFGINWQNSAGVGFRIFRLSSRSYGRVEKAWMTFTTGTDLWRRSKAAIPVTLTRSDWFGRPSMCEFRLASVLGHLTLDDSGSVVDDHCMANPMVLFETLLWSSPGFLTSSTFAFVLTTGHGRSLTGIARVHGAALALSNPYNTSSPPPMQGTDPADSLCYSFLRPLGVSAPSTYPSSFSVSQLLLHLTTLLPVH